MCLSDMGVIMESLPKLASDNSRVQNHDQAKLKTPRVARV